MIPNPIKALGAENKAGLHRADGASAHADARRGVDGATQNVLDFPPGGSIGGLVVNNPAA